MANIAKCLRTQYPADELHILVAKRNSGSFTYDGIELGGERVCAEIEEELQAIAERGGKIRKLSVVGYSLGGLVARYAVGLLDAKGILDTVECMVSYPPGAFRFPPPQRTSPGISAPPADARPNLARTSPPS